MGRRSRMVGCYVVVLAVIVAASAASRGPESSRARRAAVDNVDVYTGDVHYRYSPENTEILGDQPRPASERVPISEYAFEKNRLGTTPAVPTEKGRRKQTNAREFPQLRQPRVDDQYPDITSRLGVKSPSSNLLPLTEDRRIQLENFQRNNLLLNREQLRQREIEQWVNYTLSLSTTPRPVPTNAGQGASKATSTSEGGRFSPSRPGSAGLYGATPLPPHAVEHTDARSSSASRDTGAKVAVHLEMPGRKISMTDSDSELVSKLLTTLAEATTESSASKEEPVPENISVQNQQLVVETQRNKEREHIDPNYFNKPLINFVDYALLSIEDYQKELAAQNVELPPMHRQHLVSADLTSPSDSLHMRQAGPLCGVFLTPLFNAEVRAVNVSTYLIRNMYMNSRIRSTHLRFTFHSLDGVGIYNFTLDPSDRLELHDHRFFVDMPGHLSRTRKISVADNLGYFNTEIDVSQCVVPRALTLGPFISNQNLIQSRNVLLRTSNVMTIEGFTYTGTASSVYFWAGVGRDIEDGVRIPSETGNLDPISNYINKDITLKLPHALTFYDIDYVAVICIEYRKVFGYIKIKQEWWGRHVLPPAIVSERVYDERNYNL
ncbi:uncharacterized protein LOC108677902 isoform X2 [Hyalella azteca]|uniref:Uncharacterized protein LOC108677902 isoform X2 n=1 Tax=Hyalella azteca TaxID=294128 RepID=A0A8B7P754_HYAAZ|nr:uncharacterized protein LOC108677902 isoform X2 [Hyalella azteca]